MISVMIADDHKMIREGLKKLIELDEEIKVIAEADDGQDCLTKLKIYKPDILLLDINMPVMNGIEALKLINRRKTRPKVLMLTVHDEVEYVIKAIDLGIEGYVLKDSDSSVLIRAIRTVYDNENFIQPSLIPILNSKLIARDIDKDKIESLSTREMEVLKLCSYGLSNKEVASKLDITERTVKNHLFNIYRKIDCSDRTQAAVFCIRNGLVDIHK